MKEKVNYARWKYTVSLQEWLRVSKVSKQKLYDMLAEIMEVEVTKIVLGEAHTTRYEVYTSSGFRCYAAFEKLPTLYVVLLYENHYESYEYRRKPTTTLELTFEQYDYKRNGVNEICFSHSSRKASYYMSTIIIGRDIRIGFLTKENIPFYKIIARYQPIFYELTKCNPTKEHWNISMIEELHIIYKMILNKANQSEVLMFNVERPAREYIRHKDGEMIIRVIVNEENYVMVSDKGKKVEWEEDLIHHETFTCENGKIYGHKGEVTDEEYARKTLLGMKEGRAIYIKLLQE